MSPNRHRPQHQDRLKSTRLTSRSHSPQQRFLPSFNRSVPNLTKSLHPNRALGFSSIKDFARTVRRPLATLPANISQAPTHSLRASTSLYGTLRDQCSPPPPPKPDTSVPLKVDLHRSLSSSADSFTPDHSGISNDSSHPTTPSPAKHRAFHQLESSPPLQARSMGNNTSSIIRKPLSIRVKPSVAKLDDGRENTPQESQHNSAENKSTTTSLPRGSALQVRVPRRRSSLTVLHLDSSHFETVDPKQPDLQHRASTLTEPRQRRPSTLAETIRPAVSKASTLTPATEAKKREQTLSPPLLSPMSRPSSNSSRSPSVTSPTTINPRNSAVASRIHLPRTFPDGPVLVSAAPLTKAHYKCYQGHLKILVSRNHVYPVPCMTCGKNSDQPCWKCSFCLLRICGSCMSEFAKRKKSLEGLMTWLEKRKDEEGMKEVVPSGSREEDGEGRKKKVEKVMEENALKKVVMARKRETR